MTNSFFKAIDFAQYEKYSEQQGCETAAQYAADMAQVHPHELKRAGRIVARLGPRGTAAALAFLALWIACRVLSHTPQRQLTDSHNITKEPRTNLYC